MQPQIGGLKLNLCRKTAYHNFLFDKVSFCSLNNSRGMHLHQQQSLDSGLKSAMFLLGKTEKEWDNFWPCNFLFRTLHC